MNDSKRALLLIGSPRGEKSSSASLGNYLISKLEESEMTTERLFIHRIVNREDKIKELFEMIDNSDLIILSFPLYIDCLPAPVIKAMELIKAERVKMERKKAPNFIAICNNGFPEASQNMVALEICRIFSKDCGFVWKGGISIGGGAFAIDGKPLEKRGGMAKHIMKGLDITASALKNSEEIPQEAIDSILAKPISPKLYLYLLNFIFFLTIRKKWVIGSGLVLSILGIPLMVFGIITGDTLASNLGIPFTIIGLNLLVNGLIIHLKTKN